MNRERIAGLALQTFPAAVRAADGPELIATALDSHRAQRLRRDAAR
jgi:hypothetical protein